MLKDKQTENRVHSRAFLLPQRTQNVAKITFFLHICKKSSNFAAQKNVAP